MTAPPLTSPSDVASSLLATLDLQLQSLKVLQRLWAGYGFVCEVIASDASGITETFIIKLISPPPAKPNDEGHLRKILSYQVEQYFYTHLAPRMPEYISVAKCFASINEHHEGGTSTTAMLLTNLRTQFPVAGEKRGALNETQVFAALTWLSSFHGFWWDFAKNHRISLVKPPLEQDMRATSRTLWLNGGYTYLATRRTEFDNLKADYSEWTEPLTGDLERGVSLGEMVAAVLAPSQGFRGPTDNYQTIIHGDVKSENLFTSTSGEKVAFYDFQYAGIGLGVCDLAKLFTCSVPIALLVSVSTGIPTELGMQSGEKRLLEHYLGVLTLESDKQYKWDVFVRHWETALVDWLRFQASWGFWGNTEWLEARVRSILKDGAWRDWIMSGYRSLQEEA